MIGDKHSPLLSQATKFSGQKLFILDENTAPEDRVHTLVPKMVPR
jgi:hypothetical protein